MKRTRFAHPDYELLEEVGRGAFGVVYRARRKGMQDCAVKVFDPEWVDLARAARELEKLQRVQEHRGVVTVYDFDLSGAAPFYAMGLHAERDAAGAWRGRTLAALCGKVSEREAWRLVCEVAEALAYLHEHEVIHCDVKPGNVLLTDERPVGVKVCDFGQSRGSAAQWGERAGTVGYAAPEQLERPGESGEGRGYRWDVYGFGVTAVELLTGRWPRLEAWRVGAAGDPVTLRESLMNTSVVEGGSGGTIGAILARLRTEDEIIKWPADAKLDRERCKVAERCLALDPTKRFGDMRAVAGAFRELETQRALARSRRTLMSLVGLTLLALGGMVWAVREIRSNLRNLRAASMADFGSALKAWREDFESGRKGERANGFGGKSRWHEAVALLARSLQRDPQNERAALWLYDTLLNRTHAKGDSPRHFLHKDVNDACFSPDGARVTTASADRTGRVWDAASGAPIGAALSHDGNVVDVTFSPDGARVATASADRTARVWDATSGAPIGVSLPHDGGVVGVVFSPEGNRLATWDDDGGTRIWDFVSGRLVAGPMRHGASVKSVSFSPNGVRLLTLDDEGTAQLWDVTSGEEVGEPLKHEGGINGACFSPNGTRLVTAGNDETARMWDAATGKAVGTPMNQGYGVHVTKVCFSPNGRMVATGDPNGEIWIWDAETCKALGEPIRHENSIRSISFSPDGGRLISASADNTARIWSLTRSGAEQEHILRHAHYVTHADFSPDGLRVVTASEDGACQMWDALDGTALGEPMRHIGGVWRVILSPAGTMLLCVGADRAARVWDLNPGRCQGEPLRHGDRVNVAHYSPDGARVATASDDGAARVWNPATGTVLVEWPPGPRELEWDIRHVSFSPDGKRLATASELGVAQIWDADNGQLVLGPLWHGSNLGAASFNPSGDRLVTVCVSQLGGSAKVWSAHTGDLLAELHGEGGDVTGAEFSPDGKRLVTAGTGGQAQLWDVAGEVRLVGSMRHDLDVTAVGFNRDGTMIVTGERSGKVRVWNAGTCKQIGRTMRHGPGDVSSACFSPDGRQIVTAGGDGAARVWDVRTGSGVGEPMRHAHDVRCARVSPDGKRVVTASNDDTVRIWDLVTGRSIGEPLVHRGSVVGAEFSPDGTTVLTASADGTARLWRPVQDRVREDLTPVASEVVTFAFAVAGLRFTVEGELELLGESERLATLRDIDLPRGPWADLAGWIRMPASKRTAHPLSSFSNREIAERERDFDGAGRRLDSLKSALAHDLTVPLARLLLAGALESEAVENEVGAEEIAAVAHQAAVLRRFDLKALARERGRMPDKALAFLYARAASSLNDAPAERQVGIGPSARPICEKALNAAEKALGLDPGLSSAYREKAMALGRLGRGGEAIALWEVFLPEPEAVATDFTEAGNLAAKLGDGEAALRIFAEAKKRFPRNESVHRMEGWAAIKLGKPATALKAFESAMALLPPDLLVSDLLLGLSLAQWLNGDRTSAVATFRRVVDIDERWSETGTVANLDWPDAEKRPLEELRKAALAMHPGDAPE